jgi:hypothetical protein
LKTSQHIWAKFKSTYEHEHNTSQVGIHKCIFSFFLFESQSTTKFLEEWQGALDEVVVARLVSQSITSYIPPCFTPTFMASIVTIQNSTPNQTFTKLLGKNFQESTMNQTSNNNSSKSTTLFVGNKGKFNGDKNQNFHTASSSTIQLANNNKTFYKDKRRVIIVGRKAT